MYIASVFHLVSKSNDDQIQKVHEYSMYSVRALMLQLYRKVQISRCNANSRLKGPWQLAYTYILYAAERKVMEKCRIMMHFYSYIIKRPTDPTPSTL